MTTAAENDDSSNAADGVDRGCSAATKAARGHASVPWSAQERHSGIDISSRDHYDLARVHFRRVGAGRGMPVLYTMQESQRANAAFIVRACNANDDLVAALKLARDEIHNPGTYSHATLGGDIDDLILAVLSKAGA